MTCEVTGKPCKQYLGNGKCLHDGRMFWIDNMTGTICVWERKLEKEVKGGNKKR
jgi:hypothetical protein